MNPTTPQTPEPPMPQVPEVAPATTPPAASVPPVQPGFTPAVMPTPVKSGGNKAGMWVAIAAAIIFIPVILIIIFMTISSLQKKAKSTNASTTSTTTTTKTTVPTTSAALACLVQDDYKWFEFDKQPASVTFDDTYNPAKFTNNATDDMFFKPDSTVETSLSSVYDDWADFAKHAENKQWKFRLEGSTYGKDTALAASKKLANDRAQKVISELVKRGVPASRIVIDSPHDYSNEPQTSDIVEIYRRVQIVIDPTCTTSAAPTSTTGH